MYPHVHEEEHFFNSRGYVGTSHVAIRLHIMDTDEFSTLFYTKRSKALRVRAIADMDTGDEKGQVQFPLYFGFTLHTCRAVAWTHTELEICIKHKYHTNVYTQRFPQTSCYISPNSQSICTHI